MTTSEDKTRNKFPKSQRLCSRKSIEALFQGGDGRKSVSAFPLRAVVEIVKPTDEDVDSQPRKTGKHTVLVSVSKRKLRHAVDRNRAKRQMREAWRLNRDIIATNSNLNIAFIWQAETPQPTTLIERKMRNLLHRISEMQ